MMDNLTDEQLMARLQQGQTDALDALYQRYADILYVFCSHTLQAAAPPDAEDLVQDVFVRVIKAAASFDPHKASFRTWMFRIARNRCIDVARRAAIRRFIPLTQESKQDEGERPVAWEDGIADEERDVEGAAERAVLWEAVRACIEELDNRDDRQALVLYYVSSKVYREIGAVLGKSTSMARKHVKSAQEKVRRCLEGKGIDGSF